MDNFMFWLRRINITQVETANENSYIARPGLIDLAWKLFPAETLDVL